MHLDQEGIPLIEPVFQSVRPGYTNELYMEAIKRILRDILPYRYFADATHDPDMMEDQVEKLQRQLPLIRRTPFGSPPCDVSFLMLSQHRHNAFKFFYEIISRWLIPGHPLNAFAFFAIDFRLPEVGEEVYTLVEIAVHVSSHQEMLKIQRNWPGTELELNLGIKSAYHARRILEIKGLSADEKTALIQEHSAYLMRRRPEDFQQDLISEMQHMLVTLKDDFKAQRSYRHLSRIIAVQYLFRQALRKAVKEMPNRRHLSLKLIKARIGEGQTAVLGVLVVVNFIRDHEVFEEQHLLKAISNYIPSVKGVTGSFFTHTGHSHGIATLYMEIEKTDGGDFNGEEIRRLRRELPSDLKDRIQHLIHPTFMPQNEEEIMRNMLSLAGQLRFLRDIPQVMISFDEQTAAEVSFMVIYVRVQKEDSLPISQFFEQSPISVHYIHDRSKIVGYLRKRYPKEASVFRIRLPKEDYLRRDHTLDLQKARQVVADQVQSVLGEFRDFNGGMISKQNELFCSVHNLLADVGKANEFLLENFFYSITPVVARSILEPRTLKNLFLMLLEALEESFFRAERSFLKVKEEPETLYVMIKITDAKVKEEVGGNLEPLNISSMDLARTFVTVYDNPYLGYIYSSEDPLKRQLFIDAIQQVISPSQVLADLPS